MGGDGRVSECILRRRYRARAKGAMTDDRRDVLLDAQEFKDEMQTEMEDDEEPKMIEEKKEE